MRAKPINLPRLQIENLCIYDGEVFKNAVPHSRKFGTYFEMMFRSTGEGEIAGSCLLRVFIVFIQGVTALCL